MTQVAMPDEMSQRKQSHADYHHGTPLLFDENAHAVSASVPHTGNRDDNRLSLDDCNYATVSSLQLDEPLYETLDSFNATTVVNGRRNDIADAMSIVVDAPEPPVHAVPPIYAKVNKLSPALRWQRSQELDTLVKRVKKIRGCKLHKQVTEIRKWNFHSLRHCRVGDLRRFDEIIAPLDFAAQKVVRDSLEWVWTSVPAVRC